MNQRNQCFILKMCVTLAMQSKGCASNNCGSIDLSSNGIIYTICRLCADYSFKGYSHDTGVTFILERVHSISVYFPVFVYMIPKGHLVPYKSFRNEFIPGLRNYETFCSGIMWAENELRKPRELERLRLSRSMLSCKCNMNVTLERNSFQNDFHSFII